MSLPTEYILLSLRSKFPQPLQVLCQTSDIKFATDGAQIIDIKTRVVVKLCHFSQSLEKILRNIFEVNAVKVVISSKLSRLIHSHQSRSINDTE